MSLHASEQIARWDAERLALVLQELGGEGAPVDSGWMACDVPGSWADYAGGLGMDGEVSDASLDSLVNFYQQRGRTPKIAISPYQHPSLLSGLRRRGFVLDEVQHNLVRTLDDLPSPSKDVGIEFIEVDPAKPEATARFVEAHLAGFFPTGDAPAGMHPIARRVVEAQPRSRQWLAMAGETIVGSGGLERYGEGAALIMASTVTGWRRRGIQQAFFRYRLEEAARMGCRFAIVGSSPGGPTERNAIRCGFRLAGVQLELSLQQLPAMSYAAP
ncbi:MAG: hypothetical protein AAFV53_13580 [Myxococcota bacterium]